MSRRRFPQAPLVVERLHVRTRDFFIRLDSIGGARQLVSIESIARFAPIRGGLESIRAAGVAVVGDRVRIPRIWLRAVISLRGAEKKKPPGEQDPEGFTHRPLQTGKKGADK